MHGFFRSKWSATTNQQSSSSVIPDHQTSQPTKSVLSDQKYDSLYGVDPVNRHLVQGYADLITDRVEKGWSCNLVTFLFSQLPGTRSTVIHRMKDEVQRVYSTFLTRVHRKPRTAPIDELPILVGAVDLSVYKRDRTSAPTVPCNGGLHVHAVVLVPSTSRLDGPLEEHFRDDARLYTGRQGTICGIHVRPVVDAHERVVDYVFKTVLRGAGQAMSGTTAMESFFSSLKTERTARKMCRTRDDANADVFDYIECFYNPKRRHSTIGYLGPMEFERQTGLAGVNRTGCSSLFLSSHSPAVAFSRDSWAP
jgi:Integrase core domain